MIRFSEDRSWDDLLPRLREALARGAFTDLAEAQRAFDLAANEPLDCGFNGDIDGELDGDLVGDLGFVSSTEMYGEITSKSAIPFTSLPFAATPFCAPGLPRTRALRTELLERRDALSAMPVAQLACCSAATAVGCQAMATVWQATGWQATGWQSAAVGRAPTALIPMQEDGGHHCDRPLSRSVPRSLGRQRAWPRRTAAAVHDYALAELLADRAATCPADCLEYAVA